jgi:predicted ATP-dependent endonuclease of OLD family
MHLHTYRLRNFRRLKDVRIELASDISLFVGANNSGKTSATQALQMFWTGSKHSFSLHDFSSQVWKKLNEIGEAPSANDATAVIPSMSLDLWFEVAESDLALVLSLLPSSDWSGKHVGLRIEFAAQSPIDLLNRYRGKKAHAAQQAAALGASIGAYVPWPKSLADYLEKTLEQEFEFKYYVLDRAQFSSDFVAPAGYEPLPLAGDIGGDAVLKSLLRINCLNAQRHLSDPAHDRSGTSGRSEDLSRRLSRFYKRNLKQREEDHKVLKALFDSEAGLNSHLGEVFKDTLDRIATLGYPGINNPRLEIMSGLNPAAVMSQDAQVHYVVGGGASAVRLPDSYSGLGFKNLIYMVVEILDHLTNWRAEDDKRPPLHLIFIEEPEAHLHAQLQQVFIRKVLTLLELPGENESSFKSQIVITTHSPHILYERGFSPIRYFRRHLVEGEQTTDVLNLSSFQAGPNPKDRDFLQRYLKLTHCDLFFADAVILVEGNVERLLLPLMIEKSAETLRSASICILEVGGAFGHRFKELIEFLGVTTLIVTDIDSVVETAEPAAENEDEEKEFEVPGAVVNPETANPAPVKHYGKTCIASEPGAVTANQTLIQWIPKKQTIETLLAVPDTEKSIQLTGMQNAWVRVAYQVKVSVTLGEATAQLCGRTLEEAFGLENAAWCQLPEQKPVGLKLRTAATSPEALASGLHKRVIGKHFDKTKFALEVLSRKDWTVPKYIRDGLTWLKDQVDLERVEEGEAALVAANAATAAAAQPPADLGQP